MPTTPWHPASGPAQGPAEGVPPGVQAPSLGDGALPTTRTPRWAGEPGRRSSGLTGSGGTRGVPRRSALTPTELDDHADTDDQPGLGDAEEPVLPARGRRSNDAPWRDAPAVAPRRSAVSAMSVSSPVTPDDPPSADPRPRGGRSPFARPLPGEKEPPAVVAVTRRLVEEEPTPPEPPARADAEAVSPPTPSTPRSPSVDAPEPHTIRIPGLIRTTGRRSANAPKPAFALANVRTLILGLAGVLALLLLVGGGTFLLTRPGSPIAITVSEKPLALPATAGEFTREAGKVPSLQSHSDGRSTLTATYERGGKGQFVVLASRPERDAASALEAASAVGVQAAPGGACGRIGQQTACAVMATRTTALVGVTQVSQTKDELIVALRRVAEAMG